MGIVAGRYRYMSDLLNLDRCRPHAASAPVWPTGPTPISLPALLPAMHCHPNQAFSAYIFEGLSQGFRVGFDRRHPLLCRPRNHPSTDQCPLAVSSRITSDVQQGYLVGPVPEDLLPLVHVSPIGLVPKPHSDKFRMIVDLLTCRLPAVAASTTEYRRNCAPYNTPPSTRLSPSFSSLGPAHGWRN